MVNGNTTANLHRENRDVFYSPKWLDYNLKNLIMQKFGMQVQMPKNVGSAITFQAWIPPEKQTVPVPLVEGVTPDARKLSKKSITAQVVWYGNFLQSTDLLEIMDEDGKNLTDGQNKYLGTLQTEERDTCMFNILVGGTNVFYANGAPDRSSVVDPVSAMDLARVARSLKLGPNGDGRGAKPITSILSSNGNFGTTDIDASYVVLIAPELEYDVKNLSGFVSVSAYANPKATMIDPMEIGKVDKFRFITLENYNFYADAGGSVNNTLTETGAGANIYPMLILGEDAYANIPLTGETGMTLIRKGLGEGGTMDPLNQRATVGYKNPFAAAIFYQERMARLEVAATDI